MLWPLVACRIVPMEGVSTVARKIRRALPRYERPEGELPRVPWEINDLPTDDLMELMVHLVAWANHIGQELAEAEIAEKSADDTVDRVVGKNGYDFRKPEAKTRAFDDESYLGAIDARRSATEYRKRVAALYAGVDRDIFVVSRNLSRRTGLAPSEGRASRFST